MKSSISFKDFCEPRGFKVDDLISLQNHIKTFYDVHQVKVDFKNQLICETIVDTINRLMNCRFKLDRNMTSITVGDETAYKLINLYSQRVILICLLANKSQVTNVVVDKDGSILFYDKHSNSYKCVNKNEWIQFSPHKKYVDITIGKPEKLISCFAEHYMKYLESQKDES